MQGFRESRIDASLEMEAPAVTAELVPANQAQWHAGLLASLNCLLEVSVADDAGAVIVLGNTRLNFFAPVWFLE